MSRRPANSAPAHLLEFNEGHGWARHQIDAVTLWLKGFVNDRNGQSLAAELARVSMSAATLETWLQRLRGHFALAAEGPGWAFAAADRTRSTPMFYEPTTQTIAAHAPALVRQLGLALSDLDPIGAQAVAMSGYTVGNDTLYRSMRQLRPGEAVLFAGATPKILRWHTYRPWEVRVRPRSAMVTELTDVTLGILRRVATQAAGRQIVIPLSAGLDSRLIASGLVHLGYPNLKFFSYGQSGNHEAHAARRLAAKMNVPWRFLPNTHRNQSAYFRSTLHRDYIAFADSCAGSAFMQDLPPLHQLLDEEWISRDCIIINGNSGDYISGGHIPPAALTDDKAATPAVRWNRMFAAYAKKHLSLWDSLKTPEALATMQGRLYQELDLAGAALTTPDRDHGSYEFLEFQDRQCKWVISGQRIYDFLGLEWRLPLWDDDYLDFWQGVPMDEKRGQSLYREMLTANNWAGVWQGFQAPRWPQPRWLQPVRLGLKALHAPLGAARWHAFERQYLHYWMSATCNYAVAPYTKVASDRRGHRNGISFQNEAYLAGKGLDYGGRPLAPAR